MSGYELFRQSLPDAALRLVEPAGTVDAAGVRNALALAITTFFVAFVLRTALRFFAAFGRLVRRRALFERTNRAVNFLRKVAGLAAVGLPWFVLWRLHETGALEDQWYGWAGFAAWLWWMLRAADHQAAWLDLGSDGLVLQQGFGPFRVKRLQLPLAVLFADAVTRTPVAAPRQRGAAEVVPRREAWDAIVAQLGGADEAERWVRLVIRRLGLRAPTRWRVAE